MRIAPRLPTFLTISFSPSFHRTFFAPPLLQQFGSSFAARIAYSAAISLQTRCSRPWISGKRGRVWRGVGLGLVGEMVVWCFPYGAHEPPAVVSGDMSHLVNFFLILISFVAAAELIFFSPGGILSSPSVLWSTLDLPGAWGGGGQTFLHYAISMQTLCSAVHYEGI